MAPPVPLVANLMGGFVPTYKLSTIRKHPSLYPLIFAIGIGVAFAGSYIIRLVTYNIDTSWRKTTNPHPWQRYKQTDRFKMFSVSIDFKKNAFPTERPNID